MTPERLAELERLANAASTPMDQQYAEWLDRRLWFAREMLKAVPELIARVRELEALVKRLQTVEGET